MPRALPVGLHFLKDRSLKASRQGESVLAKALPIPFYILLAVTGFMFSSRYAPFLETDENQNYCLPGPHCSLGVKHEFINALHGRYRKEGIIMPFPIQSVEFRGPVPTENKRAAKG